MTGITREYLDRVDYLSVASTTNTEDEEAALELGVLRLTRALRRVLDLADEADENHARYMEGPILDRFIAPSNVHTSRLRAALAGTQTDGGVA